MNEKISVKELQKIQEPIETEEYIKFLNLKLDAQFVISDTVIDKSLIFENVKFNQGILGENTLFRNDFKFIDCFIRSMFMDEITIGGFFHLKNVEINSAASFTRAKFNNNFKFENCKFGHITSLDQIEVNVNNINFDFTIIKNTVFDDLLDLSNSKFNSLLFFENTIFNYTVDFSNIKLTENTFNKSRYSALNFNKIKVNENSILKFIGEKDVILFENDVAFAHEEIRGKIEFEYANYHKINVDAKDRFAELIKTEQIIIGKGCIKYRFETPRKRIFLGAESQNLVTELSNTFVQFFINKNGINLGVEVRERNENYIDIIYFTDENIHYEEFENMLRISENEMWQLVRIKNQNVTTQNDTTSLPDKILAGSDTVINLLAIIFKILTRIPLGKISTNEINALMATTSFSGSPQVNLEQFKTININQTILLGIGNTQSTKLS